MKELFKNKSFYRFILSSLVGFSILTIYTIIFRLKWGLPWLGNDLLQVNVQFEEIVYEDHLSYVKSNFEIITKIFVLILIWLGTFFFIWKGSIYKIITPFGEVFFKKETRQQTKEIVGEYAATSKFHEQFNNHSAEIIDYLVSESIAQQEGFIEDISDILKECILQYARYRGIKELGYTVFTSNKDVDPTLNYLPISLNSFEYYIVFDDYDFDELSKLTLRALFYDVYIYFKFPRKDDIIESEETEVS